MTRPKVKKGVEIMLGWLKTILVSGFVIGLVVYSGVTMTQQNSNTRATMEVEGALMTALLGDSRGQGIDSGLNKDEFITAVVSSIVDTQKNHGKTVKVSYLFLDKGGNATTIDEDIRSIQFKTEILNKKDPTQTDSVSEKRLAIDVIGNRDGAVGNGIKTKVIVFEPGTENRTKTETISNLPTIESVTTSNGTVTHAVSGNQITVSVNGGVKHKTLTGGKLTPAHTKYVQMEDNENYSKDGYVGKLIKYTVAGGIKPEDTKYVTLHPTANYDKENYKGTLERYLASGSYTPAETRYVTGQGSAYYSSGGFSGRIDRYVASGYYLEEHGYQERMLLRTGHGNQINYNDGGYSGELYHSGYFWGDGISLDGAHCWVQGCAWYIGYVFRPEIDTRVYKYQGDVTKPAVDTRKYAYRGLVKRVVSDTRETKYQGNVTKPGTDTRTYKEEYTYVVTVKYRD